MGKLSVELTMQTDWQGTKPNRRNTTNLPQFLPPLAPADRWYDGQWLLRRSRQDFTATPLSIYRFSPLAWRRDSAGHPLGWHELIYQLLPYVADLGFTHLELTDVEAGQVDEAFATFIVACHESGIGVILDWHLSPEQEGASDEALLQALEWIERYHLDGLHFKERDGVPVTDAFIETLVQGLARRRHDVLMLIDRPVEMPVHLLTRVLMCNTRWSRNALEYLSVPPEWRSERHHLFHDTLDRAFDVHFLLPWIEEGTDAGQDSWFARMPGDSWQQFANLRAAMCYMWAHPGKKLLSMGTEFAQGRSWRHGDELDWALLDDPLHAGMLRLVGDLNRLYGNEPALYDRDIEPSSFTWVIGDDVTNSAIAFLRYGAEGTAPLLVVINFTPRVLHDYRVGVPTLGAWREILNSDSKFYGGSNVGNAAGVYAQLEASHGLPVSVTLTLPPLGALFLRQGDWPA